jgi:hypothetical protein
MADEPRPDLKPDDRPRFFSTLNGWIAGLTGLVLAFAGLFTACDKLFRDEPAGTGAASNGMAAPAAATTASAARRITSYTTGDGGTLRRVEGMWVWTDKDGTTYRYQEEINDGVTTIAVLKQGGENGQDVYLRWPNAGGMALQSFDNQANWNQPIEVTPAAAN